MTLAARWFCALALILVSPAAFADPVSAVADILRQSGQFGVARGPNTVDDATKAQLLDLAKTTAAKTGAKTYLVILPSGTDPAPFIANYDKLGMTGKDALIVSNGPVWDLRCNALSAAEKQGVLDRAMRAGGKPLEKMQHLTGELSTALTSTKAQVAGSQGMTWNEFQHANAGKGWDGARMSKEYQAYRSGSATTGTTAMTTSPAPASGHAQGTSWFGLSFFVLAVVGLVGWVVYRRRKRDANLAAEMKQALAGPESTMADLYLGLESGKNYGDLLETANNVDERIKALKSAPPTRENIAKAAALNEEANRVRSLFNRAR